MQLLHRRERREDNGRHKGGDPDFIIRVGITKATIFPIWKEEEEEEDGEVRARWDLQRLPSVYGG